MLNPLTNENIIDIILETLNDKERGLGNLNIDIDRDALNLLADLAGGDARIALNALELAVLTSETDKDGRYKISVTTVEECIQKEPFVLINPTRPIMTI